MTVEQAPVSLYGQYQLKQKRRLIVFVVLALALLLSLLLDLQAGPANLGMWELLRGLLDPASLSPRMQVVVWQVRLPDALIAVLVGAALGVAGAETQTVLNNPLASPFTLGVSALATLGASMAIVLAPTFSFLPTVQAQPLLALAFALLGGVLVLLFNQWMLDSRESVVLFGIALMFLANALTAALQYVASAEAVQSIVFWTIGNLTKASWEECGSVALVLLLVLPFSWRQVSTLTLLRAGESQAVSLGLDVGRIRRWAIMRVSILAAFAVCFVGTIGFVGLVGPHISRLLLGEDHRFMLPGAGLCGALLLSLASWLSKSLLPGAIVPVGIITAVIGVPVFLGLIVMRRSRV